MTDREAAKLARPPSDEEPWVVADDTGLRLTFRDEAAAWRYRDQYTDRLINPTVTHEPATPEGGKYPPGELARRYAAGAAVSVPPGECSAPDCDCEPGWCRQRVPATFTPRTAPLPFDPGYVHAYLKAALLSVEPEGLTDPQAAYFLDWLEQLPAAGVKGLEDGQA